MVKGFSTTPFKEQEYGNQNQPNVPYLFIEYSRNGSK